MKYTMKKGKVTGSVFFIGLIILIFGCSQDDSISPPLAGQVLDVYSNEPIENIKISILENGPVTYTDSKGNFAFSSADLGSLDHEEIEVNGFSGVAISLTHEDFRFRETNLNFNEKNIFKVIGASVPAYAYTEPVQLNDGLNISSLEEAGVDNQAIQNVMDKVYRDDYKEIHSILVFKDDRLVIEEYFFGNNDTIQFEEGIIVDHNPDHIQWSRKEKHYVASLNKALTSLLVGIALDQNNLSVDEKIADYLPDYSNYFEDANKAAVDFENCLTMTSGFQWDEWGDDDLALLWQSEDFADFVLSRSNFGPASEWRYNSALPNLLLKCVDNIVEGSVRDWAHENFYEKLGIEDYNWQNQPDGFPEGAARMFIRSRDLLKIGATILNNGQWNGTQVIPESWVNECFQLKESTTSGDYSYYFWLRSLGGVDYLSAEGDGGNYINIFPDQNMVVVITQGNYLKWPSYVTQVEDIMENYILPAILD